MGSAFGSVDLYGHRGVARDVQKKDVSYDFTSYMADGYTNHCWRIVCSRVVYIIRL